MNFEDLPVKSRSVIENFVAKIREVCGPLGHKVYAVVNYDGLPASVRYRNWPDFRVWPVACLPEGMLSSLLVPDRCRFLRAGGRVMERAAPAQRRRRRP